MARFNMILNHNLSQEEALKRVKELLGETKKNHVDKISDLRETWNGNKGTFGFTAKGFDISGSFTVNENTVELDGTIPFAATFFQGRIRQVIQEAADKVFAYKDH